VGEEGTKEGSSIENEDLEWKKACLSQTVGGDREGWGRAYGSLP